MNTPKSETPEVDALLDEHGKLLSNTLKYPTEQALIQLSRKLERERDNLKSNNEGLCVAIGNFDAAIRRIAAALTGKACGGVDTGHEINPETGEPYGPGGHTGWLLAEEAKKLVHERDALLEALKYWMPEANPGSGLDGFTWFEHKQLIASIEAKGTK